MDNHVRDALDYLSRSQSPLQTQVTRQEPKEQSGLFGENDLKNLVRQTVREELPGIIREQLIIALRQVNHDLVQNHASTEKRLNDIQITHAGLSQAVTQIQQILFNKKKFPQFTMVV